MNDKQVVFCTIAHPDDEAFGPSGTIALLARTHEVHVVCFTNGASDPRFHPQGSMSLSAVRAEELKKSAAALGVHHVHFLGFQDGSLSNNLYHDVAEKLSTLVQQYHPMLLVTNELRGVSGHLDHVAVAMITSYVYKNHPEISAIWYNCTSREVSDAMGDYFVFFPPGFTREQVDKIVDVSSVWEKKIASAQCHTSQQKDVDRVTKRWESLPKEEWFFINQRSNTSFL